MIHDIIIKIEDLYVSIFETSKKPMISLDKLISKLEFVKQTIINEYKSLFVDKLDELIDKIKIFGYHFATLDIRQDSRIHSKVFEEIFKKAFSKDFPDNYSKLSIKNKIKILSKLKGKKINKIRFEDDLVNSTIESIGAMKSIQSSNGIKGCHRYIISNNQTAVNILEVFTMFNICNWENLTVDIVPLFETINDLEVCSEVMETVYNNYAYKNI